MHLTSRTNYHRWSANGCVLRLGETIYPDHKEYSITVEGGAQRASFTFKSTDDFQRFAEKINQTVAIQRLNSAPVGKN